MQRLVDACLSACGLFSTGDQATLTSLDLSWNKLGPRGVADILQGLISNQVLTHLNVAFNGVGNAGVLKIADFLKKTTMLQWLDISHNRIGLEAIPTLVKGLINNMTLHTLKVWHLFTMHTVHYFCTVCEVVRCSQVGHNPIGTAGAALLVESVQLTDPAVSPLVELNLEV